MSHSNLKCKKEIQFFFSFKVLVKKINFVRLLELIHTFDRETHLKGQNAKSLQNSRIISLLTTIWKQVYRTHLLPIVSYRFLPDAEQDPGSLEKFTLRDLFYTEKNTCWGYT
jgi:hypothetical protein